MLKFVVVILALVASISMGATPAPVGTTAPVVTFIAPGMAPVQATLPPVVPTVPEPSPQMAPEPTAAPTKKTSAAPVDKHVVQIAFLLISSMLVMMW